MKFKLEEIAKLIDGTLEGDSNKEIIGINSLENAGLDQISHAVSEKYKDALIESNAGAVIINQKLKQYCKTNAIIVKDVYLGYSILSHKFKENQDIDDLKPGNEVNYPDVKISSSSLIGKNVDIGLNTTIYPNCVIEDNCVIGDNCLIESNSSISSTSLSFISS